MSGRRRPSQQEGFLRALLGAVADTPVYVYDREIRVVECFWGRGESPWGIEPKALVGRRLGDVLGADDAAPFERLVREVFETGKSRRLETSFLLPVGRRWFETTVAPIGGATGEVEYVLSASNDVTERRRTEDALRESERRFQALAEAVPIGILRTSAEGRIVFRNRLAERLSGHAIEDLEQGDWQQNVHPDDRARMTELRRELFRHPQLRETELRLVAPDGAQTWVLARSTPAYDAHGRFDGFITSFFDITKRKRAEDALRESERRHATLAASLPVGVWRTDAEARLVYANRRLWEILDLEPESLAGVDGAASLARIGRERGVEPNEALHVVPQPERVAGERVGIEFEMEWRTADGSERWVHVHAEPERDSTGEFIGHVGALSDITALKCAERELARHRDHLGELVAERTLELERSHDALRRSERLAAVGTFAAGIAHQINNPVGAILLASQFALDDPGDRGRVESALRDIAVDARHCGRIVRSVLEFAQGPTTDPRPCDLNQIAEDCVQKLAADAAERGATLRVDLDAHLAPAAGSESALEQVLVNLVNNSIEAAASEIVIATRQSEQGIELVVRDDGCGIADKDLERIFDPLYTTRATLGGTGLGLALARGVVEAHGGSIEVRSSEAVGTEVSVRLLRV